MLPDRTKPGDILSSSWLNSLRDAVIESIVGGEGIQITRLGQNIVVAKMRGGTATAGVPIATRLIVTAIANDYLTCRRIDADDVPFGDSILVAKPIELRHDYTLYSGLTGLTTTNAQTVSATDGTTTEVWKVTLDYQANESIIWAQPVAVSGVQVGGNELRWIDANVAARAWAVEE